MRCILLLLGLVTVSCAPRPATRPPDGVRTVAVAPPANRSGSALVVSGQLDLAALFGRPTLTAMEVMAAELERRLRAAGFTVVPPGDDADLLTVGIDRFDPDVPALRYVAAGISARLTSSDGRELWVFRRDSWTVPTQNALNVGDAWAVAARSVAKQLLVGWMPAPR